MLARKVPNFFIVGAPRCGTTSLYEYLRRHSDVFMPAKKEFHVFATDFQFMSKRESMDEYLEHFTPARDEKRIGEASVFHLFSKNAAEEIRSFADDARIIICLRKPIDMLRSLHSRYLLDGDEDIDDFWKALAAEEARKSGTHPFPAHVRFKDKVFYSEIVDYGPQIQRYYDAFGRSAVHVVIADEMATQPAVEYRKVLDFLGVDPTFQPEFRVYNKNMAFRSRPVLKVMNVMNDSVVRTAIDTLVPLRVRRRFLDWFVSLNRKETLRSPIADERMTCIAEMLEPKVRSVESVLGRAIRAWR